MVLIRESDLRTRGVISVDFRLRKKCLQCAVLVAPMLQSCKRFRAFLNCIKNYQLTKRLLKKIVN